jgi:lipid-binding SYLF domain-containing protein
MRDRVFFAETMIKMSGSRRTLLARGLAVASAAAVWGIAGPALAQDVSALNADAKRALDRLVGAVPAAKALNEKAVAVLVFPRITKVGLVFGGQYGEGVLFRGGKPAGYFANMGASWGLQAGAQQYGYAMFFMTEAALGALTSTAGFEIGVGPSVVVVDQGMAKLLTTMNLDSDIYAFVFSQRGLMAGVGLRGNRIVALSR